MFRAFTTKVAGAVDLRGLVAANKPFFNRPRASNLSCVTTCSGT